MLYPPSYGSNPRFPRACDFSVVECGESFGKGVVSHRPFRAGELLAEFSGELLPEITQHTLQVRPGLHIYDPHFVGYLLHSCEPNVALDMQRRTVTALRDITRGEYLTMDYAQTEDHLYRQFACGCGSARCRGWIMGREDVVDELAMRKSRRRTRRKAG